MLPYLVVEKEVQIHLEEHYQELEEFVVKPKKDRSMHNNENGYKQRKNNICSRYVKTSRELGRPNKSCWNVAWGY